MIDFQHRQISLPDGTPTIVCRIKGSIDGTTVYQFEKKLTQFIDDGFRRLIIVFSQVQYINSTGMGVLVKLADRSKDAKGDFCLIEVPDRIIGLFNVLGLLKLIKSFATEEEAIKHFQTKKTGDTVAFKPSASELPQAPPTPTAPKPAPPASKMSYAPPAPFSYKPAPPATATPRVPPISSTLRSTPLSPASETKAMTKKQAPNTSVGSDSKSKIFAITCKKCSKKIALGNSLVEGTYKCPLCMATFKISANGKIQFL